MINKFLLRSIEVLAVSGLLVVPETSMAYRLSFESVSINRGETMEMPLILENEEVVYGFQLDMTLPTGLEFVMEGDEPDISLTSRMAGDYHFTCNFREDQALGIATFSITHTPISGNDGAVAIFKIAANEDFYGGPIVLRNIICISQDNQDIIVNDEYTDIILYIPAESITLSNASLTLTEGETAPLSAKVNPSDATDKTVTWSSSDESVAIVSAEGVVTAVKAGTTIITAASSNGLTATCQVTVDQLVIEMETILLNVESLDLEVGDSFHLTAEIIPAETTYPDLEWWVDDEAIATVEQNGLVTMLREGETTVHVRSVYWPDVEASCHINVISGVEGLIEDNAPCDVYTTDGVLLKKDATLSDIDNLSPGIYIIRQGQKTTKLLK